MLVMFLEQDRAQEHNWCLKSTWTLAFIMGAVKLQTMVAMLTDEGDYKIELPLYLVSYLALTVVSVFALFVPSLPEGERPRDSEYAVLSQYDAVTDDKGDSKSYGSIQAEEPKKQGEHNVSPEDEANIFSRVTFWWMNTILALGHKRALEENDLYALARVDKTDRIADMFQGKWDAQMQTPEPSISKALLSAFLVPFLIAGCFKVVQDTLTFAGPLFLNLIIKFVMGSGPSSELWYGVMLALLMMTSSIVQSLSLQTYFFKVFRVGMHLRAAIVTIVYSKAFRLSPKAKQGSGVGDIVNHMAIDAERLMALTPYLHMVWSGPVQVIVSIALLYVILSWSVFAGIAVMILMIPVNALAVKKLSALQKEMMKLKDGRVKKMNETLQGIRLIKFFAWEQYFLRDINDIRDNELAMLRKSAYLRAVLTFLWMSTPLMVSIVTFIVYTVAIDDLSADVAFTSISLFNILRFPLNMLPAVISGIVEARVSLVRLNKYLLASELDFSAVDRGGVSDGNAIEVRGGVFRWDRQSDDDDADGDGKEGDGGTNGGASGGATEPARGDIEGAVDEDDDLKKAPKRSKEDLTVPTLEGVDLTVPQGKLMAVIGQVGSGKSSFLEALLGTIPKLDGYVRVSGRIAYVAQEACIQNATLRDNILFGLPFNQERYDRAVRVCELVPDIEMLPAGDQTEIGEKGINLSGGQKQRVSMARAVYADADVYLLDDPLSAVDAHVGKAIFENCIVEALKGKTRVLVTHQLQYMHQADCIAVLDNRQFAEVGPYKDLMESEGRFSDLITKHVLTSSETGEAEDDVVEDGAVLYGMSGEEGTTPKRTPTRTPMRTPIRTPDRAVEEKKEDKAKLIQKEDRQVGEVKSSVYIAYIASLGGVLIVTVILVLFALEQATKVGADYWVSWWTDDTTEVENSDGKDVLEPNHSNTFYLTIYSGIGVANAVATLLRGIFTAIAGINSAKYLHERLLSNVLRVPMAFFDTTPVGRILNRFSKDQYVVDETLPRTLSMFVVMMFAAVAVLVVIGSVTPFFLTALLPLGWLYRYVQKYYLRSSRELKRLDSISRSPIYAHFSETLEGVTTIRAYGRVDAFVDENFERINRNQRAYFVSQVANRWLGVRLEFVGTVVVTLAALFAVLEKDNINAGSAGLSITYALQTTALLNWMVRMYTEVETQMVAVERLDEYSLVDQEAPAVLEHNRPPAEWPSKGRVKFDRLQLRYREGMDLVLKNVTADIKPQEKVGVVGRTGAGKSTLMLALFRMMEPAGGTIEIDDIDITTIGLKDLRSKLSIIPQDPTLFTGTVRSNLDPFHEFSDHEIWRALEAVHLKEAFSKEELGGLDEAVTEGGQNLSVGQRQLMCLARALMRRSRILVMDEATAAVDFETDSLIQETIRREFKEMTVMTIAHRVNTIIDSDRVMVLDAGRLAEFDTPDRLLQDTSSIFYGLVNKSQGGE